MKKIVVVDYGMGNLRSVAQALRAVAPEAEVLISGEIADLKQAERIVLPGQGAMPDCMKSLEESGLKDALMESARSKPIFGVCVGEQMLFDWSEEGDTKGLACCPARSSVFSSTASVRKTDRVTRYPRWDGIRFVKASLTPYGTVLPTRVSFISSTVSMLYRNRPLTWLGETEYGTPFCSAIACDNIFATQFHPGKKAQMSVCNCTKISYTGIPDNIINP